MSGTERAIGKYRWVICSLIFLATTINYIDRQILALIKEFLDQELGWTNEQFGLVNSAFQGAYAVGLFLFGWFIDKYGTKIGYATSLTLWSVAALLHALVASVSGFFGARVFLGISEGGNFPAAIKGIALWFPKRERAFATAIFNSGTNVGAIIAPAGYRGPAFLVFDNFHVLRKYNNSTSYVLAVGQLADRMTGKPPIIARWPTYLAPLSRSENLELQRLLTQRGYNPGAVDGIVGPRTQTAVKAFQKTVNQPNDGFPTQDLLEQLRRLSF